MEWHIAKEQVTVWFWKWYMSNPFVLELAHRVYIETESLTVNEKLTEAYDLSQYGMFSAGQLAQIVRLDVSYLYKTGDKALFGKGGRFNPKHLPLLTELCEDYIRSHDLPDPFTVQRMIAEGTSLYVIHNLTGIPRTSLHRKRREADLNDEANADTYL